MRREEELCVWQNIHTHVKNIFVRERNKQERGNGNTGPREFRVIRKGIAEMTHEWRRRWGAETRILGRVNSTAVQTRVQAWRFQERQGGQGSYSSWASFVCMSHHPHFKDKWKCQLLRRAGLFVTPWTVVHQAPVSMGFPRQEHWSELHFLFQGIFLTQELNPGFSILQAGSLPLWFSQIPSTEPCMEQKLT